MPELPEVQTTVDGLRTKVLNRTFIDVWSDHQKMVKRPTGFDVFKKLLLGRKIINVWRRAKNVVLELSGGYSLLVHMKMTGHLMVGKWKLGGVTWVALQEGALQERINGFLHMVFSLDDGYMIALSDMRKFAKVELVPTEDLLKEFKSLGPEPLDLNFTFKKFETLIKNLRPGLRGKKGKIKQVMMDPEVIAGIGNIYASEALWLCRIHPERQVGTLKKDELKLLYAAIKKVLKLGIKFGGDSFSDYRNVEGKAGVFEAKKNVYQREGKVCNRCKGSIVRLVLGGRSAFFCPVCQK